MVVGYNSIQVPIDYKLGDTVCVYVYMFVCVCVCVCMYPGT